MSGVYCVYNIGLFINTNIGISRPELAEMSGVYCVYNIDLFINTNIGISRPELAEIYCVYNIGLIININIKHQFKHQNIFKNEM